MKVLKRRLWFSAKRYGWGWTPATWEGWAVTVGYLVVFAWGFPRSEWFWLWTATIALLLICFVTGEKPRWRWGK